ncbi:hypothetical protein PIB30_030379 [Stylosanthes scabra]|uniref:Uncharacterized protein n=1 Tax=Stylosanthes scabra TaxID=79078 RepID=A0ABU6XAF2_9FABA|nr:hypothetical protein [Stylosanthes scabra]
MWELKRINKRENRSKTLRKGEDGSYSRWVMVVIFSISERDEERTTSGELTVLQHSKPPSSEGLGVINSRGRGRNPSTLGVDVSTFAELEARQVVSSIRKSSPLGVIEGPRAISRDVSNDTARGDERWEGEKIGRRSCTQRQQGNCHISP